MKFYVPCDKAFHIEKQEVSWINEATLEWYKNRLVLDQWAHGYIFEADESFQSFFAILAGIQLPCITDQEYNQLLIDKVAYLDKARTNQIRMAWSQINS